MRTQSSIRRQELIHLMTRLHHTPRVDYNQIAELYDSQPFRGKEVDPDFQEFLAERTAQQIASLCLLDIGCGTGNQLVENRPEAPGACLIGLDRFRGMLKQARPKADDIHWPQGDGAALPLRASAFDFINNQYSFHHVHDKPGMTREVYRILKSGGRFVMSNICPQEVKSRFIYEYFPETLTYDLQDFMPPEDIVGHMREAGFVNAGFDLEHIQWDSTLTDFEHGVTRRDSCSQLITISDEAYQAGLDRVRAEIKQKGGDTFHQGYVCVVRGAGDKG